jgi:hypothetical protein
VVIMTEFIETPLTPEQIAERAQWQADTYQREYDAVTLARHTAYTAPGGSDAVYMKYQRGEATEQEWLDAVQAINNANPYPVKVK